MLPFFSCRQFAVWCLAEADQRGINKGLEESGPRIRVLTPNALPFLTIHHHHQKRGNGVCINDNGNDDDAEGDEHH